VGTPLSPEPVTRSGVRELPAYLSNGLVGLRVLDIPLLPGIVLVSGYTGLHPIVQVDSAAPAPYPLAGDVGINRVFLTTSAQQARFIDQRYDFATGELTTRFAFAAGGTEARFEVLTFCSQKEPTLVLQEVAIEVADTCDVDLRALVYADEIPGKMLRKHLQPPGSDEPAGDGSLAWKSLGEEAMVGVAYATEFLGDADAERECQDAGIDASLATDYRFRARPGRTYRLRQIASIVPSRMHHDPDRAAARLVARAAADGFERVRQENQLEWKEHWEGRIIVTADDDRWQRLADAALFYLHTSVHPSAPSSTSMYGLAQWNDYHYYYGHVMWDIELFAVPPLVLLQPDAARSILEYRTQSLGAARNNAKLQGRRGIQFPWESGPHHGEESAPGAGTASWHEDHVSVDVAWAFSQYAHATGDGRFLKEDAAAVLYGVADWLVSRVTQTPAGFEIRRSMGIAETRNPIDNDAFTTMGAITVLREAIATAEQLGDFVMPRWRTVLGGLRVREQSRGRVIRTHDDFRPNEPKGATPDPLAGLFPLWFPVEPAVERATLDYYLGLAEGYIGSPMLSPLYGVWAAWAGDRRLARKLYEEGYADLVGPRFLQTLEQSPTRYPEKPPSGPFFANLGGFLMGLLYGLPGIRLGQEDPEDWPARPVVLPEGWKSIEVERAWVRMEPARIVARHGDARATIEMPSRRRRRAA
jgi:protein-glucosylgalactosylhydroxylysine glucosidase